MTGPHWQVPLDEDYHVHSTFSDGASTLAENGGTYGPLPTP